MGSLGKDVIVIRLVIRLGKSKKGLDKPYDYGKMSA